MYLDTSVLVKRYVAEPDSEHVDEVVVGFTLVSSELALGEVWSALLAKERAKALSAALREKAWKAFLDDIDEGVLRLIPLDGVMIREANDLMLRVHPHVPLRTLDAIHLATYGAVITGPIFTKDKRMLAAAKLLGFAAVE
ncbi:MAG TPA: type II toxin-antitoxin system VapC family toxin [Opitutaceae bacterium]|nr:type II toxin-antitoxin system VapC family toxin [Opitutaceae bacterium]